MKARTPTRRRDQIELVRGLFAGIENYTYIRRQGLELHRYHGKQQAQRNTVNDTLNGAAGDDMLLGNGGK
jgi:hypothetical protein